MVINENNMDYGDFYEFSNKMTKGAINMLGIYEQEIFFDNELRLLKGDVIIDVPLKFVYHFGTKLYDSVAIGWAALNLLSDRVINLLKEHQITGWKTYPAVLYDKKGNEIKGYSLFAVTGRSGPIDWNKSEKFVRDPYIPGGGRADLLRGVYFDLDTWDGSDIFLAGASLFIAVTQKVRDLLVKNKITNIRLKRVTEIETIDRTVPVDQEAFEEFMKSITIK